MCKVPQFEMRHESFTCFGNHSRDICATAQQKNCQPLTFMTLASRPMTSGKWQRVGGWDHGYRTSIPWNSWPLQMDVNDQMVSNGFREDLYWVGWSHFDGDAWYFDLWSSQGTGNPSFTGRFWLMVCWEQTSMDPLKIISIFHGSSDSSANIGDSKSSKSSINNVQALSEFVSWSYSKPLSNPFSETLRRLLAFSLPRFPSNWKDRRIFRGSLLAVQRWSCWSMTPPMKSWMMHGLNLLKLVSWLVWEVSIQKHV